MLPTAEYKYRVGHRFAAFVLILSQLFVDTMVRLAWTSLLSVTIFLSCSSLSHAEVDTASVSHILNSAKYFEQGVEAQSDPIQLSDKEEKENAATADDYESLVTEVDREISLAESDPSIDMHAGDMVIEDDLDSAEHQNVIPEDLAEAEESNIFGDVGPAGEADIADVARVEVEEAEEAIRNIADLGEADGADNEEEQKDIEAVLHEIEVDADDDVYDATHEN